MSRLYFAVFSTDRERLNKYCSINKRSSDVNILLMDDFDDVINETAIQTLFPHKFIEAFANYRYVAANKKELRNICLQTTPFYTKKGDRVTGISFVDSIFGEGGLVLVSNFYCIDEKTMKKHLNA